MLNGVGFGSLFLPALVFDPEPEAGFFIYVSGVNSIFASGVGAGVRVSTVACGAGVDRGIGC